jgi:hypothetical protein
MSERERVHEEAERQAEDLERRTQELGEEIGRTRQDWESKKADEKVPGAHPEDPAEEHERADEDGPPKEAEITPGD